MSLQEISARFKQFLIFQDEKSTFMAIACHALLELL